MAKMIDIKPEFYGEAQTWESFLKNLPDDIIVYNHREINGREFDFCILSKEFGIIIVEVKGWKSDHIFDVVGVDEIIISGHNTPERSPKKQARAYRFGLLNAISDRYNVSPLIFDMVCYPFITKQQYLDKRLDIISEPEMTIFKEDLLDGEILRYKLIGAYNKYKDIPHSEMTDGLFQIIRQHFEPNFEIEKNSDSANEIPYSKLSFFPNGISKGEILNIVNEYFTGIKQFVFVTTKEDKNSILEALLFQYKSRNICIKNNGLALFCDADEISTKEELSFRAFNIEIYVVDKISDNNLVIIEGRCTDYEEHIVKELGDNSTFNSQQFFIEHASTEKNVIVKAGAGTGKTYSMVSRIAYLCNKRNNPVQNIVDDIVMVTFTNDAADNMKSRLKQMFMNYFVLTRNPKFLKYIESVNQMQISTIHKFARKIIQSSALTMGLGNDFEITSGEFEKEQIYEKYLNEFILLKTEENSNFIKELKVPIHILKKMLISFSNQLYNKSIDVKLITQDEMGKPIESMPYFNEIIEDVIIKAEKEYSLKMIEGNKIDLRESMILLNNAVNSYSEKKCNLCFKYIFIDEFQDTDDSQIDSFLKIKDAIGVECKLFVVGDLKQSIYRFRGANISAFDKLKVAQELWSEYTISTNYRTDKKLLRLYDDIFNRMGIEGYIPYKRGEDTLISYIDAGGEENYLLNCIEYNGENEEEFFDKLVQILIREKEKIESLDKKKKLSKEEKTIAVLVRENWQIDKVVKEAKKRGIVIETKVGGDLYQLTQTMDLYKLLMALNNPYEPVYLVNFLESNYVNLKLDYQGLHGISKKEKLEIILDIMNEYFLSHMSLTWKDIILMVHSQPILVVLKKIYEGLQPWKQYSNDIDKQRFYKSNYELILEKLIKNYRVDYLTLNVVYNSIKISVLTKQEEISRNVDSGTGIRYLCTTIHKAKGLEYGTVVLPYTNQSIEKLKMSDIDVNYSNSVLSYSIKVDKFSKESNSNYDANEEIEQRIQEEARVLYVALTRAIRNCIWMKDMNSKNEVSWSTLLEG